MDLIAPSRRTASSRVGLQNVPPNNSGLPASLGLRVSFLGFISSREKERERERERDWTELLSLRERLFCLFIAAKSLSRVFIGITDALDIKDEDHDVCV